MKSKESLLEGLALAFKWTITNYWQWEANHKPTNFQGNFLGDAEGNHLKTKCVNV